MHSHSNMKVLFNKFFNYVHDKPLTEVPKSHVFLGVGVKFVTRRYHKFVETSKLVQFMGKMYSSNNTQLK